MRQTVTRCDAFPIVGYGTRGISRYGDGRAAVSLRIRIRRDTLCVCVCDGCDFEVLRVAINATTVSVTPTAVYVLPMSSTANGHLGVFLYDTWQYSKRARAHRSIFGHRQRKSRRHHRGRRATHFRLDSSGDSGPSDVSAQSATIHRPSQFPTTRREK